MPDARGWQSPRQRARLDRRASLIWLAYVLDFRPLALRRAADLMAKEFDHFARFVWPRWEAAGRPIPSQPATSEDIFAVLASEHMAVPGARQVRRILRATGLGLEMAQRSDAAFAYGD